jgi:hypothetical protein
MGGTFDPAWSGTSVCYIVLRLLPLLHMKNILIDFAQRYLNDDENEEGKIEIAPSVILDIGLLGGVPRLAQHYIFALGTINGQFSWGNYFQRLKIGESKLLDIVFKKVPNLISYPQVFPQVLYHILFHVPVVRSFKLKRDEVTTWADLESDGYLFLVPHDGDINMS